jgi:hypothetical protein
MAISRRRWIVGCAALLLVSLVVANGLLSPRYFRTYVYVEWNAKTGFSTAYVFPPNERVAPLKRLLGSLIAFEARPFIASELKKSGWEEANGYFVVWMIPVPPAIVLRASRRPPRWSCPPDDKRNDRAGL